jgi:hypothetical protein
MIFEPTPTTRKEILDLMESRRTEPQEWKRYQSSDEDRKILINHLLQAGVRSELDMQSVFQMLQVPWKESDKLHLRLKLKRS